MRKHRDDGAAGVNLAVIITPFLDMAFQILSFFIMTYHPSALEGHIPGSLVPPDQFAKKAKENNPNPTETPLSVPEDLLLPELQEALQVQIKSVGRGQVQVNRSEGEPSQILLKQAQDANYQVVADTESGLKQSLDRLEARLKEIAAQPGTEKANVKIEGDGDLKQQYVMMVYDVCKRAGYAKVHFVPPPILREAK